MRRNINYKVKSYVIILRAPYTNRNIRIARILNTLTLPAGFSVISHKLELQQVRCIYTSTYVLVDRFIIPFEMHKVGAAEKHSKNIYVHLHVFSGQSLLEIMFF